MSSPVFPEDDLGRRCLESDPALSLRRQGPSQRACAAPDAWCYRPLVGDQWEILPRHSVGFLTWLEEYAMSFRRPASRKVHGFENGFAVGKPRKVANPCRFTDRPVLFSEHGSEKSPLFQMSFPIYLIGCRPIVF